MFHISLTHVGIVTATMRMNPLYQYSSFVHKYSVSDQYQFIVTFLLSRAKRFQSKVPSCTQTYAIASLPRVRPRIRIIIYWITLEVWRIIIQSHFWKRVYFGNVAFHHSSWAMHRADRRQTHNVPTNFC